MGVALFDVWWVTALAEQIPPDKLSRVIAYDYAISLALMPLGYMLAGPAANALGAANVLFGGRRSSRSSRARAGAGAATRDAATLERRSPEPATPPGRDRSRLPRVPVALTPRGRAAGARRRLRSRPNALRLVGGDLQRLARAPGEHRVAGAVAGEQRRARRPGGDELLGRPPLRRIDSAPV